MIELQLLNTEKYVEKHQCTGVPLVPTLLLATIKTMLLNTDLRWYGHYHRYQIGKLVKGLQKNQNNTQTPAILTQIILLICLWVYSVNPLDQSK